ncbi:hypothetical protein [Halobacterium salinarum]|uniref:hypothetical protein n=1 Tax=Halobacterium salinarum TaxID=2242 RepID=UPI001F41C037|nr:hypothetical protein [Halobacterium salinarum]MCF2165452.1 hypothetical protein [Halobacterium salinarum]MCF2168317.1 hypothetical protein [Halobacterium salinarum]
MSITSETVENWPWILVGGLALVGVCLVAGVMPAAAAPPQEPGHGLNSTEFYPLWSHDVDGNVSLNVSAIRALSNATDLPYDRPPQAVQTWNSRDFAEFPSTGLHTSVYPNETVTTATEQGWITDAYTRLFAIQPSTRALVTDRKQPLYVPSQGSIMAATDFRVDLPEDDTSGSVRVFYDLQSAGIESVQAVSGARTIGSAPPSHAVQINYSDLQAGRHSLGVEAEISARVTKTIKRKVCTEDGGCDWETETEHIEKSLTVSDTQLVTQYSLLSTGYVTKYPNGDMGVVTKQNHPWAGLSLPGNDTATGVWKFYSGRETDWDTLKTSTPDGTETVSSPAQPLQVFAFPSSSQPAVKTTGREAGVPLPDGEVMETQGERRRAPTLPSSVTIGTVNQAYNVSSQIAVRHEEYAPESVSVRGLVAGTSRKLSPSFYTTVETRETSLDAEVINSTSSTLRVRVELTDALGDPVMTAGHDGSVSVAGTPVETNAAGTAIVRIERVAKGMTAQYEPAPFWKRDPAYTSSRASFAPPPSFELDAWFVFRIAYNIAVLFVLPLYLFDKMFNLGIWPPWRGIW